MVSFDFGDCGVDATATGAIVTLVDIEVLQLKVTELGRVTSPIHLISSGKLPLLSKENVVKLLTSSLNNKGKRKGKGVNRAFLDALYPPGCDENERALAGMKALWVILSSPSLRFFAEAWTEKAVFVPENQSRVEYSLDKRLGAGGFGLVYSFKDEKETVLKVARYMKSKSLELEIKALQILSDDSSYPCSIEKLITTGTLEASIRGNKVTLKALQLSPRGKSMRALYIEETTDDGLVAGLRSVAHDMHEALTFVHRHNLRHLDVRPSNIIYTRSGGRVMGCLIDFGLARQGDCSLDHFIGSVKFAHSGLLEHRRPSGHKGAVRATERLDWAALGYSLAVMKARGFISWGNLSCHNTAFDDDVNERDDVTVAALEVILGSQRRDFESVKLHKKLILSLPIEN